MPLSILKPGPDAIRAFLAEQAGLPLAYEGEGRTRDDAAPPPGHDLDRNRVRLGSGEADYARAVAALRRWAHFGLGWVEVLPADAPVRPGVTLAVLIRIAPVYWLNATRIVYVEEVAEGPVRRVAFAYGTLAAHAESGEERFAVEWRAGEDGSVWYEVTAFSRPRHLIARLGYRVVRLLQRRFARDSMRAMVEAVGGGP